MGIFFLHRLPHTPGAFLQENILDPFVGTKGRAVIIAGFPVKIFARVAHGLLPLVHGNRGVIADIIPIGFDREIVGMAVDGFMARLLNVRRIPVCTNEELDNALLALEEKANSDSTDPIVGMVSSIIGLHRLCAPFLEATVPRGSSVKSR
jgi:hypothetical protein